MKKLQGENFHQNGLQFEEWMQQKVRTKKKSPLERSKSTYQVPVVVHVIHNGEPNGSGRNISDAQILSQIAVLNKDYQRLNNDAINTPAEFQAVAGTFDIEFVLAKQNPEGLATTGIVRVQGTKTSYTINDNYEIKSQSYWPAEDYLNIWVCNLGGGLLGYAQFPVSGLSGLENSSGNRLTDGIVVSYNTFGSEDFGTFNLLAQYKKGRTTTHEIGHFFGLRHTWGDDDGACSGTDYVSDTPNQADSSNGCPSHPRITCGVTSMFQNYLDYTDDVCMNLFTLGQVGRMTAVVENSPRRVSLLTSHGLSSPLPVANDVGIKEIISPMAGECSNQITPVVQVKNYGSNAVSSTQMNVKIDGIVVETKAFTLSPTLAPLESATVSFSSVIVSSGLHSIIFEIILTNNVADGGTSNNVFSQTLLIPQTIAVPFAEDFEVLPASWQIVNPDLKTTWQLASAPKESPSNKAMKMDFFNYEDNLGEIDALITPLFDLSSEPVALLLFDIAYAQFENDTDGLKVILLSNCNADITQGTVVYDKAGAALSTAAATSNDFTPSNETQWRKEFIDLSSFAGQSNLQLAFVGINDWGNNLYLDNISLITTPLNDLSLQSVISPTPVLCANQVIPKLQIENVGTLVFSLKVKITLNGIPLSTRTFSGLNFNGGTDMEIQLPPITLRQGENTIVFEVIEPNGLPDINLSNNTLTAYTVVNDAADEIPLRQNFEQPFEDEWVVINPRGGMKWEVKNIDSNNALFFNGFDNTVIGDQGWLVSPTLDFSAATEASLSFDLSYAFRGSAVDQLQILASTDCGETYSDTLLDETRATLSNGKSSNSPWTPTNVDWKTRTLNLSSFAGQENVRIAFVFTNGNGNNIYLDNIGFFVSAIPSLPIENGVSVFPVPVSALDDLQVIFNLPEKNSVTIEVLDLTGKTIVSDVQQNVLNQTYQIALRDVAPGVYILRAKTSTDVFTKRIMVK